MANNTCCNPSSSTTTLFMDRLSHSVIKETSKNLKYYIDVKRRENGFILNPSSTATNSIPLKARYMYGTTKEYPSSCSSFYSDNDLKIYLRNFHKQEKKPIVSSNNPEKKMCREELNFHMRSLQHSSQENYKFSELRLRSSLRSSSSCSMTSNLDFQKLKSNSTSKLSRYEYDQLVDNTANLLASMIKTRRSVYEKHLLSQRTPANYDSRNTNPSPRQFDDPSNTNVEGVTSNNLPNDVTDSAATKQSKKSKRTTENIRAKASHIMKTAKPITNGIYCDYQISVTTGSCNGASTTAPVRIILYGTKGRTELIDLADSESHRVPFVKGQTDQFTIRTLHVGKLAGITIGHDRKDEKSSWYLDKVSIQDTLLHNNYDIQCNAWLSGKSNDQKTMRDFEVTSKKSNNKKHHEDEHHEEKENDSDDSTTTDDTIASNRSNLQQSGHSVQENYMKNRQKPPNKLAGQTTNNKNYTSKMSTTNQIHYSERSISIDTKSKSTKFRRTYVPTHRALSPKLDRTPPESSDNEDENHVTDRNRSRSSTSPLILDQSPTRSNFQYPPFDRHSPDRPESRLEKHNSPVPPSSERSTKEKKDQTVEDFFD